MAPDIDDEARRLHAFISTDSAFQRLARVRQARWRERTALPIGEHRGAPLGSRLPMPFARDSLANYLTDTIRDVVRVEVLDRSKSAGKLFGQPRIFNDLLSSQPLCFNLFGELQRDLVLASRVVSLLTEGHVARVTAIEFMDAHNFCLGNVKRSCVHFVTPAGQIIPFDTYNTFYRPGAAGNARLAEARR